MITVDVQHSLRALTARLDLVPKEVMAAAVRSLNRTMTTVRAEAARDMAAEFRGLKIGTLKRQMKFKRATRSEPVASITFSNKRFRLYGNWNIRHSGGKHLRLGRLPFRLETGDGRQIGDAELRSAFIQRARTNGVPNVFLRTGRARYPIAVLVAPSLAAAYVERAIGRRLAQVARDRFAVVLQQEAKFQLSKR